MTNEAKPQGCSFLFRPVGSDPIFTPEQFTDEQRMFAQSAFDFVEREVRPDVERLERHEAGLMVDKLKKAGELGLLMIDIPERYGGLELDLATSMLCSEVMGTYASWLVSHGAHTGIGTLPLLFFGNEAQRQKYLPRLATGELLAAYALTEPSSGSDAMNARTRAVLVRADDGQKYWKLTGTKMWITNGGFADLFTVFAKVDGQAFSAFLVEADAEGFSRGPEEDKMGIRGSSTVQINLDEVRVPVDNLLGEIGKGHKIAFNVLNVGRFKLGVGAVGAVKHVLLVATRYAKERIAFGQPIAQFGAIRQKIADITTRLYALESMCYRAGGYMVEAIEQLDRDDDDYNQQVMAAIEEFTVEDSIIKVYGSELADLAVDEAVQIHGGYGYHRDYEVERAYRDSRINRIFEGTNEINRMLIVGTLLKRTMKGQLPLFSLVQQINREIAGDKAEAPSLADPALAWERFMSETAKRITLSTAHAAVQRFMTTLKDEQEILMALADQLIALYAIDSTLSRVRLYGGTGRAEIARIVTAEGYEEILGIARRLAPSVTVAKDRERFYSTLDHFTYRSPVNLIDLKRQVADVVIDRETWPFSAIHEPGPAEVKQAAG